MEARQTKLCWLATSDHYSLLIPEKPLLNSSRRFISALTFLTRSAYNGSWDLKIIPPKKDIG